MWKNKINYWYLLFPGRNIWDAYSQIPGKIPVTPFVGENYELTSIVDDKSSLYTGNKACDSFYKAEYDAQVYPQIFKKDEST